MADQPSNASGHRARLRQRLFEGGEKALLDHELVEYLLALAIPRRDTKDQAKALIARFGGIGPLLAADADALRREGLSDGVVGALKIAEATALRLLETRMEGRPILSSWDALGDYLQAAMAHSHRSRKSASCSSTPRTCCSPTRRCGAAASTKPRSTSAKSSAGPSSSARPRSSSSTITPRATPRPSQQDIRLTRDLIEAGRHMRVTVHDHVIVGSQGRSSMKALGLI